MRFVIIYQWKSTQIRKTNLLEKHLEAIICRWSSEYVFLKISQISWETLVLEPLFKKLQAWEPATFLKSKLQHRCFLMKCAKFLRTPFFYRPPAVAASEYLVFELFKNLGKSSLALFYKSLSEKVSITIIKHNSWERIRKTQKQSPRGVL